MSNDSKTKRAAHGQGGVYAYKVAAGTRYRVVWWILDAETGVKSQRSKRGFRTQKEAVAFRREVARDADLGRQLSRRVMTLSDFAADWLPRLQVRESTRKIYSTRLRRSVEPRLGRVLLTKLTPSMIDRLYRELEASGGRDGAPMSPATLSLTHTVLRRLLAQAVKDKLIGGNPTDSVTAPTAPKAGAAHWQVWNADQVKAFLAAASEHKWYSLWVTYAMTALRRGEGLGLRWSDVDFERRKLTVFRSVGRSEGLVVGPTKSGRARSLDLDDHTIKVLRQHRVREGERLLAQGRSFDPQSYIWQTEAGRPIGPSSVNRHFKKLIVRANSGLGDDQQLPDIRLHDLRHSWATLAFQRHAPVNVVQQRLGHASPSITLNVYGHATETMQQQAASDVAEAVFGMR
ncbi:MAG: Integrase [Mycobacterium sp.]|nr:Integrase [Mycobacterium sp.]